MRGLNQTLLMYWSTETKARLPEHKKNLFKWILGLQFENIPVGVEQRSIRAVTAQKTSEVVGVTSKQSRIDRCRRNIRAITSKRKLN